MLPGSLKDALKAHLGKVSAASYSTCCLTASSGSPLGAPASCRPAAFAFQTPARMPALPGGRASIATALRVPFLPWQAPVFYEAFHLEIDECREKSRKR